MYLEENYVNLAARKTSLGKNSNKLCGSVFLSTLHEANSCGRMIITAAPRWFYSLRWREAWEVRGRVYCRDSNCTLQNKRMAWLFSQADYCSTEICWLGRAGEECFTCLSANTIADYKIFFFFFLLQSPDWFFISRRNMLAWLLWT